MEDVASDEQCGSDAGQWRHTHSKPWNYSIFMDAPEILKHIPPVFYCFTIQLLSILLLMFWLLFLSVWSSCAWGTRWARSVSCTVHYTLQRMSGWTLGTTSPHAHASCTEKQEGSCKNSLLKSYAHSIAHLKGTADATITVWLFA